MATLSELSNRLLTKFKNVPNVTIEDAEGWVIEAVYQYGYTEPENVPDKDSGLLLLLAQAEGARQVALSVSHYFSYTDGEETVDKSMLSEQYRKIAKDVIAEYERQRASGRGTDNGVHFKAVRRIDR